MGKLKNPLKVRQTTMGIASATATATTTTEVYILTTVFTTPASCSTQWVAFSTQNYIERLVPNVDILNGPFGTTCFAPSQNVMSKV
jgi:hypothetical protein